MTSRTFVVVDPKKTGIERLSSSLEQISVHPSGGHRLLAMNANGVGLWIDASARSLVRTDAGELPGKLAPTS